MAQFPVCAQCGRFQSEHGIGNAEPNHTFVTRLSRVQHISARVAVQCLECGRKFKTATLVPSCPKCGGSDIEVA
jgi:DNA-directed RNA polymerase subunit RPC12/RpoP